jgi:hypothetical protein
MGNAWSGGIDDALGGGFGLTGGGEDSGGRGEGIGIGRIGTVGAGAGTCGAGCFASGHGRIGGSHRTKAPSFTLRCGHINDSVTTGCGTIVSGRLPPDVIQRIVRQNFGRFRFCYEQGLRLQPTLSARVTVKFVIDRTGAVSFASDAGSDLPDRDVVACVVRAFTSISFPEPEGGIVNVVYPLVFTPE